jgi:hypothetical protein
MSFVLAFSWRGLVLAKRDRDRANKNEISILVCSVTTKDFPHDMLLHELNERGLLLRRVSAERFFAA